MKRVIKNVYAAPDRKVNNIWVGHWYENSAEFTTIYHSHSYCLWTSINRRCGLLAEKNKAPSYKNCSNGFESYQSFAEWCQTECGYGEKDKDGYFWPIDKDLLVYMNNIYSEDTCIFVPRAVNSLLISRRSDRGNYPLGVHFKKKSSDMLNELSRPYYAQISVEGKRKSLGSFDNPLDAHKAWQKAKIRAIEDKLYSKEFDQHTKLLLALQKNVERILNDLQNDRETIQ